MILDEIADLNQLFENGELKIQEGKYFGAKDKMEIYIHPYMQPNVKHDSPYLFHRLYNNKNSTST